jgi:hypothetical protein
LSALSSQTDARRTLALNSQLAKNWSDRKK